MTYEATFDGIEFILNNPQIPYKTGDLNAVLKHSSFCLPVRLASFRPLPVPRCLFSWHLIQRGRPSSDPLLPVCTNLAVIVQGSNSLALHAVAALNV